MAVSARQPGRKYIGHGQGSDPPSLCYLGAVTPARQSAASVCKRSSRALSAASALPRHMYASFLTRLYVLINLVEDAGAKAPESVSILTPQDLSTFLTRKRHTRGPAQRNMVCGGRSHEGPSKGVPAPIQEEAEDLKRKKSRPCPPPPPHTHLPFFL